MDLLEMLVAELGNTELEATQIAENIKTKLGQIMIPKGVYNVLNDKYKALTDETNGLRTTLTEKELELENIATANMTELEKVQHALDKANELVAQNALNTNRLNATNKLQKAGFDDEQIASLIKTYVTEDEAQTNLLIDTLVSTINGRVDVAVQEKENELLNDSTRIDSNTDPKDTGAMTSELFRKLNIQERQKLFTEQPEVYAKFTNGS